MRHCANSSQVPGGGGLGSISTWWPWKPHQASTALLHPSDTRGIGGRHWRKPPYSVSSVDTIKSVSPQPAETTHFFVRGAGS